ncbi:hypothetical protein HYU12_02280, partial [Candidatus Woesearchaeota archaeon]|nr:hypothetical protein [Candidatus Woesearchaeota archaeon]
KIDTNRTAKPQRAGILLDLSTGISIDLPPIVVDKVSNVPKTPEEILREGREYIKKVKWLRKPNLGKD